MVNEVAGRRNDDRVRLIGNVDCGLLDTGTDEQLQKIGFFSLPTLFGEEPKIDRWFYRGTN